MSVQTSVEETVKKIAMRILRKPEATFSTAASFKDYDADSLDIVQILVAVEDTFDIELDDEELKNINNIGGFVGYIERKVAEKAKR
ncbi:MAG: acyl carrier protein [Chloroflexi bacterium]|nr:acyl carrier protein [Chloroflexota bacterium]